LWWVVSPPVANAAGANKKPLRRGTGGAKVFLVFRNLAARRSA